LAKAPEAEHFFTDYKKFKVMANTNCLSRTCLFYTASLCNAGLENSWL